MSSSAGPPAGRLGLYEIKGLLFSYLHIVKTLSEGQSLTDTHHSEHASVLPHELTLSSRDSDGLLEQNQPSGHHELPQLVGVSRA